MAVDKQLLDILVCPICKGPLTLTDKQDGLICPEDKLIFPIIEVDNLGFKVNGLNID